MDPFNYHYRPGIVFKIKHQKAIPGDNETDITDFFRHHLHVDWKRLFALHPHIRIKRLFCTLQPVELAPLIEKAKQVDPTYQDPELLSYFILSCNNLFTAKRVLLEVQQMEQVETAYLRGSTDSAVAVKKNS